MPDLLVALLVGWLLSSASGSEMEINALHEPGNPYCHHTDWTGNLRIRKSLRPFAGGDVGVLIDHRSCLFEEGDRYTSDTPGFSWRRRFK